MINNSPCLVELGVFENGLRGLKATEDIHEGDVVLMCLGSQLIHDQTILDTELGQLLKLLPVTEEWRLLLFTMLDKHDPESRHAAFWTTLPSSLMTGLTMPEELLDALNALFVHKELCEARKHILTEYQTTKPLLEGLIKAYPVAIQDWHLSLPEYLWAVQVWYAYAMQVEVRPGALQQCLVPFASLFNHHPQHAHIRRYGQLEDSGDMVFCASLPCSKGDQVFLSYGPLPNWHLLLFYGFAVENNPHDECQIQLTKLPAQDESEQLVLHLRLGEDSDLRTNQQDSHIGVMTALDRHISAVNSAVEKVQSLAATQSCAEMCKHLTVWLEGQAQICQWHKDKGQLSTSAPTAL